MNAEFKRVKEVFLTALEKQAPGERNGYLSEACGANESLRRQVEALLHKHEEAGSFLESPAADLRDLSTEIVAECERAGSTVEEPPRESPGSAIGPYQLLEYLGEGGFGVVFLAEHTRSVRRKVALKVLKPGMDTRQVIARFEAERQTLALMDHPNIAHIFDGGETTSGRPYFVMELVQGVPITDFCDQNHLTPRQRLELFLPVCQAVQHAHQKGIIHRDLKPSNILITVNDATPVPKVIDFGVAKALGQELTDKTLCTGFAQMIGTPLYMSPEQAGQCDLDIDTRSDIYSLGVLLYELLTGTTPFDKERFKQASYDEIRRIIREEEPAKPSTRLSESRDTLPSIGAQRQTEPAQLTRLVKGELDWIVMKALDKDRNRRYETANSLALDVQHYLADEPVLACPPSAAYRLRKFVRRNWGSVLAAGSVLLALIAGMVGTTYGLIHAQQQREIAEAARADEAAQRQLAQERYAEAEAAKARAEAATKAEAKQRALAITQWKGAERARLRTREALDYMTSAVTGEVLMTQQEIRSGQKQFLATVLGYYQEFAGEKADTEVTRQRVAEAAYRVGSIEFRLGRSEESVAAFDKARAGYAALAAEFPANRAYRHELARTHNNLGTLSKTLHRHAQGAEHHRQAIELLEELTAKFPEMRAYRQELARSNYGIGLLSAARGRAVEAEQLYRAALALLDQLAAEFPKVVDHREELARCRNSLGGLLTDVGKHAEAEEQFRGAVLLGRQLLDEFPALAAYRQQLGTSYHGMGIVLMDLQRHAEAEEQYRQALAIRQRLVGDFPVRANYRQELARTQDNLAIVLYELGKRAEAEGHWRQAVAIRRKLTAQFRVVPGYRHDLACSRINLGMLLTALEKRQEAEEQFRNGLALLEKLVAEDPAHPGYRQHLGCGHMHVGKLLKDLGKLAEAEEQYRRGLELQAKLVAEFAKVPQYRKELARTHQCLGDLLQDLGKLTEAEEEFRIAATLKQNESGR